MDEEWFNYVVLGESLFGGHYYYGRNNSMSKVISEVLPYSTRGQATRVLNEKLSYGLRAKIITLRLTKVSEEEAQ